MQEYSLSPLSSPSSTTASPLIISYSLCESSSLEETHSPYLISHWPLAACDLGVGPCGGRSTGAVIMLVLFRQTLLRVHGYIFLCHVHMSMGHYKTTDISVLWFSLPTFPSVTFPLALRVGCHSRSISWSWASHRHLVFAI